MSNNATRFSVGFKVPTKNFKQLLLGLATCLFVGSAFAQKQVSFTWQAYADPAVVGYKIYYGLSSHSYDHCVDVGNVTTASITLLDGGQINYIAATAYDALGVESDFSKEVAFQVETATIGTNSTVEVAGNRISGVSQIGGAFKFTVNGSAGAVLVVEASTNLIDWYPVQTNTAPFEFVDQDSNKAQCFYRVASR